MLPQFPSLILHHVALKKWIKKHSHTHTEGPAIAFGVVQIKCTSWLEERKGREGGARTAGGRSVECVRATTILSCCIHLTFPFDTESAPSEAGGGRGVCMWAAKTNMITPPSPQPYRTRVSVELEEWRVELVSDQDRSTLLRGGGRGKRGEEGCCITRTPW